MTRANSAVDADCRILEPLNLWNDYIDPMCCERQPRFVIDANSKARLTVRASFWAIHVALVISALSESSRARSHSRV
jgi:hypothetical protein